MTSPPDAVAAADQPASKVSAGALSPWDVGELPPPPGAGWRLWIGLLGPGVVLAGTSIGTGEWLFGPAVTAQYGATLLWLATISIVLQVFCNLLMMRYALYCGEPMIVGGLRTWPGPAVWIPCYALLDLAAIWPYNASNAAVPLAAAVLGRLPAEGDAGTVKLLGYAIFVLAFIPLIFGGTVYRMLEKIMTFKLVYVLGYLTLIAVFLVSARVAWEVATGFLQFGMVPIRAESLVVGNQFNLLEHTGGSVYQVRGAIEQGGPTIAEFRVARGGKSTSYKLGAAPPAELEPRRRALIERATLLARPDTFWIQTRAEGTTLSAEGTVAADRTWRVRQLTIADAAGARTFDRVDQAPAPFAARFRALIENQGLERVSLAGYVARHGRLPALDWAMLAAFCAIAGAGGLSNTLFSNYARDKGWGMGAHVGAIPSAIGGRTIALSHVGRVFPLDPSNLGRWRGWLRHITRDQAIWTVASFLGMALPCMLSLEFIRNATVEGNRVAAMAAEGMATRHPDLGRLLWTLTLFCGFMVLAPGQISVGDQISRRWTDIIWTASNRAKHFAGTQVKYLYYGILTMYGVWGLVTLALFDPLQTAKIGAVLGNVALGLSSLHVLYINRTLLPPPLRPHWLLQAGVACCGLFFLGISIVVLASA